MFGTSRVRPQEVSSKRRFENLGYVYQQIFTVVVRVRMNRQAVADTDAFRANVQSGLRTAEKDAIKRGYSPDDVRMATLAVVAFLDESILNSLNSVVRGWQSMPLQEELFGHHIAGETFFENLENLMSRPDSHDVADVLEVYALCLLLGYRGRYGLSGLEATRPLIESAMEKIRRIRGPLAGLSPSWSVPGGTSVMSTRDPWVRRLAFVALACVALAFLLFWAFKLRLSSDSAEMHTTAAMIHP